MSIEDYYRLRKRIHTEAQNHAESGMRIMERALDDADHQALRTAANQFRQAAMLLDQLDGCEQSLTYLRMKETPK